MGLNHRLSWARYARPEVTLACDCSLATAKRRIADAEELLWRRLGPLPGDEDARHEASWANRVASSEGSS